MNLAGEPIAVLGSINPYPMMRENMNKTVIKKLLTYEEKKNLHVVYLSP